MPRYFDIRSTVLIVVGYGILPEEEDRPVAYDLKREIVSRGLGAESRGAVVVTDMWMVNQEMAELFPAIAVGGPGVECLRGPDLRGPAGRVHPGRARLSVQMSEGRSTASALRCGAWTRQRPGRRWSAS